MCAGYGDLPPFRLPAPSGYKYAMRRKTICHRPRRYAFFCWLSAHAPLLEIQKWAMRQERRCFKQVQYETLVRIRDNT